MEQLLTTLSRAVEGSTAVALTASVIWGVLSVVLSPCHLASIPLVVAFIGGQGRVSAWRAFGIASSFAVGILVTIAAIGVVTAAAGRMMGNIGPWGNYFVAAVLIFVGLHLLDVLPIPFSGLGQVNMKRKGAAAAFLLGLVFGIALGPCTFAYMAPMLAVTFKVSGNGGLYGALLLLAYGIGHCGVIAAAGSSTAIVQRYLDWTEQGKGIARLKSVCGVLIICGGLWLIYVA